MVEVGIVLGYVDFDDRVSEASSITCRVNVPEEYVDHLHRGKYVLMESPEGRKFVGRVIGGPFYQPEGMPASSFTAKAFTIRGDLFKRPPPYYAVYVVEILGELERGSLKSTYTRPKPKSCVRELSAADVEQFLGLTGNMVVGHILGYKGVKVRLPASSPDFLPRNVGIFGTVGSGKTNTAQVLIEEALAGGWAVFVLDVEGEYTFMDTPNDDEYMAAVLKSGFNMEPQGVEDFEVYRPVGRQSTRMTAKPFGVPFAGINPYVFAELIDATEAQQRYLSKVVDRLASSRNSGGAERGGDSLEDMVLGAPQTGPTLGQVMCYVEDWANRAESYARASLSTLYSKLERLHRLGFIDRDKPIPLRDRMKPGALTVVDLSDAEDRVKNITIAWLLDAVFRERLAGRGCKTMIVIEEAHTFVSAEARDRMAATLDMLKVVARRGRKRWLSLVFVSQQPGHLPAEVFELCNTRIIHALRSELNLRTVRKTCALPSEYLEIIPRLAPGEALISSPILAHPLVVRIRPAKTKKLRFSQ